MSGGSLGYGQYKLNDIADAIEARSQKPLHRALAKHLRKVGAAVHDLEWMFSGDTSPGDEVASIKKIISRSDVLLEAKEAAEVALKDLSVAIKELAVVWPSCRAIAKEPYSEKKEGGKYGNTGKH